MYVNLFDSVVSSEKDMAALRHIIMMHFGNGDKLNRDVTRRMRRSVWTDGRRERLIDKLCTKAF